MTKELETIDEKDDVNELRLNPGHERELESVPGPELPGQRLVVTGNRTIIPEIVLLSTWWASRPRSCCSSSWLRLVSM